jgi:hypothetical protein
VLALLVFGAFGEERKARRFLLEATPSETARISSPR